MEQSPVINWVFHVRVASLLTVLGVLDYSLISYAYHSTVVKGATVQLVFGFEYAVLITIVANAAIKYVLHFAELRSHTQWENKAVFLLYAELIIGFVRVVLYVIFVVLMVKIYTLPLFAFRPMYYTMRNFKKALNDVILSRRAIRNMNTLYPDATPEELASPENICIICRENMVNNSKKLPCGHIFHTFCLRSWFQRQQTCPTCRFEILRAPTDASLNQPRPAINPVAQQAAPAAVAAAANNNNNNAAVPPLVNHNLFANLMPPPTTGGTPATLVTNTAVPLILPPPFPFMAPYAVPPPLIPPNLDQLTEEDLRALEGNERRHVEERIKLLRNVQLMLDSATALMNQYTVIAAQLPPPPVPVTVTPTNTSDEAAPAPNATGSQKSDPVEIVSSPSIERPSGEEPKASSSSLLTTAADRVKLEDVGSEDYIDIGNAKHRDDSTKPVSTQIEHVEDPSDPIVELRRRRLQKFLQTEAANGQAPNGEAKPASASTAPPAPSSSSS